MPLQEEIYPVQHLAMAVFMGAWKSGLMAIFSAYFDGSGSPDDSAAVVVAGFVATAEQWIEFERNWKDVLKEHGVSQLHMKHFAHSRGEFSSWKGDEERRARFLRHLIAVINVRVGGGFATAVMMKDYREIDARYCLHEQNTPYALAGSCCIDKVRQWAARHNIDQTNVRYFFEYGDKDQSDLIRCAYRDHSIAVKLLTKDESLVFQAADLLAYEHLLANRKIYEVGTGILGLGELRKSLQSLNRTPHQESDWGVYDRESLEMQCEKNHYPRRSDASISCDG